MTYEELCSFDTLWLAYMRARRCKRSKRSTAAFEYSAIEELLILSKSLLQGKYTPDPLDAFFIYEPKKRLIQAPTFRDKVVQHAQNDFVIYPELSRSMTLNTYAAQYGKGTHFGVDQLEGNLRTHFLRRKGADEAARKAAGLPYRPIEEWDYAAGTISREKIEECFRSWEAHAKHGDTGTLRKNMRARLDAALARAEIRRAALNLPAPEPAIIERRTKRYGTVTFQSDERQSGQAGREHPGKEIHQAGQ